MRWKELESRHYAYNYLGNYLIFLLFKHNYVLWIQMVFLLNYQMYLCGLQMLQIIFSFILKFMVCLEQLVSYLESTFSTFYFFLILFLN